MCGLAGIVLKADGDVGTALVAMGASMAHRGADSTGFALYGRAEGERLTVSLHGAGRSLKETRAAIEALIAGSDLRGEIAEWFERGDEMFARLRVPDTVDLAVLTRDLEAGANVWVHGVGRSVTVIKDVGPAPEVDRAHGISGRLGRHGTVHCRLATESRVNVDYSHPFWARPFEDITIVHHGHITNYERLRRILSQRRYEFKTENDSEMAAVYLADKLLSGETLESALEASLEDFDGTFTYLVGTPSGIGAARDRWGACPLLVAETDDAIVFGSEERALLTVVPEGTPIRMMGEESTSVWNSTVTAR